MDDERLVMDLFHMENNMKLVLDNRYWSSTPPRLQYWERSVMMKSMEYSRVLLAYRINWDQMVKWMRRDMDQFWYENLGEEKNVFHQGNEMCHHSGIVAH